MPDPTWYVLGQIEIPVHAASVDEALLKGQAAFDRQLHLDKTPAHDALEWLAWAVPEAEAK